MESSAVNRISMYENSVTVYFPKDLKLADDAEKELWDRIHARLSGFCGDLARELSTEYSAAIRALVGPDEDDEDPDPLDDDDLFDESPI